MEKKACHQHKQLNFRFKKKKEKKKQTKEKKKHSTCTKLSLHFAHSSESQHCQTCSLNTGSKQWSLCQAHGCCSTCSDAPRFMLVGNCPGINRAGRRPQQVHLAAQFWPRQTLIPPVCWEGRVVGCRPPPPPGPQAPSSSHGQIASRHQHFDSLPIRVRQNSMVKVSAVCCSSLSTNAKAVEIRFAFWTDAH